MQPANREETGIDRGRLERVCMLTDYNGVCEHPVTATREYLPASLADRYRETLEWIARVRDTPEWRTVTLTQIVDRANRALGDNHG
jgi:hypothetical protein